MISVKIVLCKMQIAFFLGSNMKCQYQYSYKHFNNVNVESTNSSHVVDLSVL